MDRIKSALEHTPLLSFGADIQEKVFALTGGVLLLRGDHFDTRLLPHEKTGLHLQLRQTHYLP